MERIKKSLDVSKLVYESVKSDFRIGMSENDIKKIILKASLGSKFTGDIISGVRSSYIEGDATDYVLQKGDCLILDLQFKADGMWCDTTRTFFVSEVSDEVRLAYKSVLDAKKAGENMLRADIRVDDIYNAVYEGLGRYKEYFPHHAGHVFGLKPVMQPQFLPDKQTFLNTGDTVTLEPGLYFDGEFGIRIEDNYLITENGFENLFDFTTELEDFIL